MKFRLFSLLLILFFIFPSASSEEKILVNNEKELQVLLEGYYLMGYSDTPSFAREMAIRDAKRRASEIAGSFVKSKTVLENGKIKEDFIEILTSSVVSIKVLDEGFIQEDKKRLTYFVKAKVTVDKKSLDEKIEKLFADKEKLKKLKKLALENKKLSQQIKKLTEEVERISKEKLNYQKQILELKNKINTLKADKSSEIKELEKKLAKLENLSKKQKYIMEKREKLVAKQLNIENKVNLVFRKGSLFELAQQSQNEKQNAFKEIDENFFNFIANNTEIIIGNPKINPKNNRYADIYIPIKWKVNVDHLKSVLKPYLNFDNLRVGFTSCSFNKSTKGLYISRYDNTKEKKKKSYSEEIYNYISDRDIKIEVSVGKYKGYLTIGTGIHCFFQRKSDSPYLFVTQGGKGVKLWSNEENPILIKNVPIDVLKTTDRISAKIIIEKVKQHGYR